jgi:ribosome modulation factor
MARRKKQKADQTNEDGGIGHNSGELTDDQRQALFFQHKRHYENALADKKTTDADFKNVCKRAKAELGPSAVAEIKDAILLDTEEGEAQIKADIERKLRVARWMAVPLGQQADLFGQPDRSDAKERAFAEGKRAGYEGKVCKAPFDPSVPQHDAWIEGWQVGQKELFNIQKKRDGAIFDSADQPREIGDQPETTQVNA